MERILLSKENSKVAAPIFDLPAIEGEVDGEKIVVCTTALKEGYNCLQFCYALRSEKRWSNVENKRNRNLEFVIKNKDDFVDQISAELKVYRPDKVRIHSSGDFFAEWYFLLWLKIAKKHKSIVFWAYSKEEWVGEIERPPNLIILYSSDDVDVFPEKPPGFDNIAYIVSKGNRKNEDRSLRPNCPYQYDKTIRCNRGCNKCMRKSEHPIIFEQH